MCFAAARSKWTMFARWQNKHWITISKQCLGSENEHSKFGVLVSVVILSSRNCAQRPSSAALFRSSFASCLPEHAWAAPQADMRHIHSPAFVPLDPLSCLCWTLGSNSLEAEESEITRVWQASCDIKWLQDQPALHIFKDRCLPRRPRSVRSVRSTCTGSSFNALGPALLLAYTSVSLLIKNDESCESMHVTEQTNNYLIFLYRVFQLIRN